MAVKLPFFPDLPAQRYTVALDGEQYEVRLVWRARQAAWYLDLSDADGVALLRGQRLSPMSSPNLGVVVDALPGALVPVGADPYDRAELELWYLDEAELRAAVTADPDLRIVRP